MKYLKFKKNSRVPAKKQQVVTHKSTYMKTNLELQNFFLFRHDSCQVHYVLRQKWRFRHDLSGLFFDVHEDYIEKFVTETKFQRQIKKLDKRIKKVVFAAFCYHGNENLWIELKKFLW